MNKNNWNLISFHGTDIEFKSLFLSDKQKFAHIFLFSIFRNIPKNNETHFKMEKRTILQIARNIYSHFCVLRPTCRCCQLNNFSYSTLVSNFNLFELNRKFESIHYECQWWQCRRRFLFFLPFHCLRGSIFFCCSARWIEALAKTLFSPHYFGHHCMY